jgi:predicted ATP-grasp superfamily ATP-dependent carboligase
MNAPARPLSVLLLDEGGHHSQKVAVCLGQIKGIKLHVLSNKRWVPVRFSRHVASFQSYPSMATEAEQLEAVLRAIKQTRSEILFPVVNASSRFIAIHQTELSRHIALTPFPSLASMDVVLDKNQFFEFLRNHNLPQPEAIVIRSVEQVAARLGELTFPVLFKPACSGGGTGIQKFERPAELLAFLRANWRIEASALIQSFVPGDDVDCSVLCRDGKILAHTIQKSFLPRRDPFGSDEAIEFIHDPQALAVVAQLMSTLNWSGVAHVDLRRDKQDGRAKLLDVSPRYWTSLLGSLASGVNFPHLSCLSTLGIEFAPPTPGLRKFFTAEIAARHILGKCPGRGGMKIPIKESGLVYAFNDPAPRAFTLAKRTFSLIAKILRHQSDV